MVMEYAEGGTLRNYLNENFLSLNWEDKYRLALQLSNAIKCLHENDIVHKDLHSGSVLLHQNSIKLADFGLSKRIRDAGQISVNSFDTIPYIDPEGFNITEENIRNVNYLSAEDSQIEKLKKGDIYSIGVLFWELSSGKKPFTDKEYDLSLAKKIAQGSREEIVKGTPERYFDIYSSKYSVVPLEVLNESINLCAII
jgi:serine/threonine protein kinase